MFVYGGASEWSQSLRTVCLQYRKHCPVYVFPGAFREQLFCFCRTAPQIYGS